MRVEGYFDLKIKETDILPSGKAMARGTASISYKIEDGKWYNKYLVFRAYGTTENPDWPLLLPTGGRWIKGVSVKGAQYEERPLLDKKTGLESPVGFLTVFSPESLKVRVGEKQWAPLVEGGAKAGAKAPDIDEGLEDYDEIPF